MKQRTRVRKMTELALLVAVLLIMAYTPLGYLKTPWGIEITFMVIPIAVGSIIMGSAAGAFLGLVFGLTSFAQCFGASPMGAIFLQTNPIGTFFCCVIPRIFVGFLPGALYLSLFKAGKMKALRIPLCCFLVPVLNTVFYIISNWIVFSDTWLNMSVSTFGYIGSGGIGLLGFMFSMVAVNGIAEAIACLILSTAICKALQKIL